MTPRIRLRRMYPGESPRWAVFTNLFDSIDRECCGGWYLSVHMGPLHLECHSRVSK